MTEPLLTALDAARRLGVKRATLYTYVSRGWLTRIEGADGQSRYLAAELDDLRRRDAAHKGHGPAATEALHWGPPVLTTTLSDIDADGPNYRGQPALTLAERHTPWEQVAELLWTGAPGTAPWPEPWPIPEVSPGPLLRRLPALVATLALTVPDDPNAVATARRLARTLAAAIGGPGPTIAASLAHNHPALTAVFNQALVLCAEHELNPSAFTARIAAAAGADLFGAVLAALATFTGAHHGGAPQQVYALLASNLPIDRLMGDTPRPFPGTGHPLYPEGDPRGAMLLALAAEGPHAGRALGLATALDAAGLPAPNLDFGLAALTYAYDLPAETAPTLFAIGRLAGWVAHALEQRSPPGGLRPRAQYAGT